MRVIKKSTLTEYSRRRRDAADPLRRWYRTTRHAVWSKFADVRQTYGNADTYHKGVFTYVIFNIGGNKYRLIAKIEYKAQAVYVGMILTHAEYETGGWKETLPSE